MVIATVERKTSRKRPVNSSTPRMAMLTSNASRWRQKMP